MAAEAAELREGGLQERRKKAQQVAAKGGNGNKEVENLR
jgi:hypothetical protein